MKKLLIPILLLFLLLGLNVKVLGAPAYYYPKKYNVTIKNINKNEIKKIEVLYSEKYGFSYLANSENRRWIKYTDFGYKYRNYSDEEIIPTLTDEQIDDIYKAYINKDISDVNGYWIEQKDIPTIEGSIEKLVINENTNVQYKNNTAIVTYTATKETYYRINSMLLRIEKTDNTVLYSNPITSNLWTVEDENSTQEELAESEKILNKTAYFEVDFSKPQNNFEVTEVPKKNNNKIDNNIISNYYIILTIVITFIIIIILSTVILLIHSRKTSKLNK